MNLTSSPPQLSHSAFSPQLAAQANVPPVGPDWLHEIKVDGYRTLALVQDGSVRLLTRGGQDWTDRYGGLAAEIGRLPCEQAVIDGEIAAPDAQGVTRLDGLQAALAEGRSDALVFHAFDLLFIDGMDLRQQSLLGRKARLAELFNRATSAGPRLVLCEAHQDGAALLRIACELGMEGIVSKRTSAPYKGVRSVDWLKVKRQEQGMFRIVGYISNRPGYVSSVALARATEGLEPICRANVGGLGKALFETLSKMSPLPPPGGVRGHGKVRWVAPSLTADVIYLGQTARGAPRAPVLAGFSNSIPSG